MDDRLIPAVYEAALEPERWTSLFSQLSAELAGAAVYLGQSRTDRFGVGDFWTVGVDPGEWNRFEEPEQSALTNRTLATLLRYEGRVVDRRVIIPDKEVGRDQLSRVFLAEQGLFHAAISVVQRDEEVAATFWVGSDCAHPLEDGTIGRLRLLAPHVGQAMRIHRALGRSAQVAATFREVLETLDRGAALLDVSLRLVYANSAARCALEADRGLTLRFGRLRSVAPGVQRALEALAWGLTDRRGDLTSGALLVPDASGAPAWRLTLAPAIGASIHGFARGAQIIAFIDDLSRDEEGPAPEALTSELGLTPAEARVAALSARALRPAEIAAALGVSVNTVKSHLKAIHGRLGIRTQAELVRTILTLRRS